MREAVIVDAVRTPFGKQEGSFRDMHAQELAAEPLRALERRNGFSASNDIEDVIYGCVTTKGEQGLNIGRIAPMVAGWGDDVPGVQLDRMCGSGQQAVNFAAGQVRSGMHDILVAGGVEHMTRVPMNTVDNGTVTERYFEYFNELTTQGEGAERTAEEYGLTREYVDEIAADSQVRWEKAAGEGYYDTHVTPVETEDDGEEMSVENDELPRPETDSETLADLPLAFREPGDGVIHAGNSSGIVDGSAALLVTSEKTAAAHGWDPLVRVVDSQVVGVDPVTMLKGPIPATQELLEQNNMTIEDIDLFEVNEAFASVIAAWLEETGAPWDRTNVWGGAIAHGHPLGATGAALMGKLAYQLQELDKERGLCTMCIGFGQGIATIIERYDQ